MSDITITDAQWIEVQERIKELEARLVALISAGEAVVNRWDTPLWKDTEPTGTFIHRLRNAIEAAKEKT